MTRKLLFKALVGSHNYNLNDENSDKDYKEFYIPTFEDMFYNKDFSKSTTGEIDVEVKDARQLSYLWWKANVNFIEVLFSEEFVTVPETEIYAEDLLDMREDIASMNIPYLFDACLGMSNQRIKAFLKGNDEKKRNKDLMSSYRIIDFLQQYAANGFTNFKEAIWYDEEDWKEFMLGIKYGKHDQERILNEIREKERLLVDNKQNILRLYDAEKGKKTLDDVNSILQVATEKFVLQELN